MSRRPPTWGYYLLTTDPWGVRYAYFSAHTSVDHASADRASQVARLGAANVGPVQTSEQPSPFAAPKRPGLLASLARMVLLAGAAVAGGVSVLLMRIACPVAEAKRAVAPKAAPTPSAANDWRVN